MRDIFLEGEKVILTPMEEEDAEFIRIMENDPDVRYALFLYKPLTQESAEKKVREMISSPDIFMFMIMEKESGQKIGQTGLVRIDFVSRAAVFYIAIHHKASRSKGFGTEATRLMVDYAFHTLNLNRIQLHVNSENLPAIHIYKKLGFEIEGTLRQAMYHGGKYCDFYVMGKIRES
ncbi:GNAT family N-acetyltransferase [Fidelibacter multiformis]|jgi:RimJ/RimL family protein N-acetyltransferase|uniref:GNAT family N-acetyltransferase n=1 Tax=Fidelibacter multiformis TaxID=3377529 RepID=UPI0037DD1AE5